MAWAGRSRRTDRCWIAGSRLGAGVGCRSRYRLPDSTGSAGVSRAENLPSSDSSHSVGVCYRWCCFGASQKRWGSPGAAGRVARRAVDRRHARLNGRSRLSRSESIQALARRYLSLCPCLEPAGFERPWRTRVLRGRQPRPRTCPCSSLVQS